MDLLSKSLRMRVLDNGFMDMKGDYIMKHIDYFKMQAKNLVKDWNAKKISEESRKRMSEAQKKVDRSKPFSEETRRKIAEANKGKSRTGVRLEHLLENQKKATQKSRILKMKPVNQIAVDSGEIIKRFGSIKEAASSVGCTPTSISDVCRGKKKQCKGFKWQYAT